MTMIAISRNIKGKSPDEAYEATVDKLPDLDYVIWKTRPLAWLVIANRELPEGKINANVSFRPGEEALLNISLSCDTMEEGALQAAGDNLADAIMSLFE